MGTRLHNYKGSRRIPREGTPRLAAGLDCAPHQRASRLLAAESLGRLIVESRQERSGKKAKLPNAKRHRAAEPVALRAPATAWAAASNVSWAPARKTYPAPVRLT